MVHRPAHHKEDLFSLRSLKRRLRTLFRQPIFWLVTVWGHLSIALGTLGFDYFERGVNPRIHSFLDSLYWAVATFTSVGYGEATPVTPQGKVIGIGVMLFGTLFLWSYMALFTGAIVAPALKAVEADMDEIGRDMNTVKQEMARLETNWQERGKESPTDSPASPRSAADHPDSTGVSPSRVLRPSGSEGALHSSHKGREAKKGESK